MAFRIRCNSLPPSCYRASLCLLFLASSAFAVPKDLTQKIKDAASRASLDPRLVEAVVQVESNFSAVATSRKGAMGLMQVMPGTASECDIHDAYHALNNLMGACDCLRKLINRYQGNLSYALAAYNAGPGNVDRYRGIPPFPETQDYVRRVLSIYGTLKGASRPVGAMALIEGETRPVAEPVLGKSFAPERSSSLKVSSRKARGPKNLLVRPSRNKLVNPGD